MAAGVPILDTVTNPCRVTQVGKNTFRIVLTQGLNRQIRRMCEHFGYTVRGLQRVRIMHVRLGDLPLGKWRNLTPDEIRALMPSRRTLHLRTRAQGTGP
jgi:23S rRNA pseudouridine2604 synthase